MVTIKPEYKNYTRLSFKGSRKPLGQRSQEELTELALLAQSSQDKSLLRFFDKLPGLDQLKKTRTEAELRAIAPAVRKEGKTVKPEIKKTAGRKSNNEKTPE